jgi:alpha-mannosidase
MVSDGSPPRHDDSQSCTPHFVPPIGLPRVSNAAPECLSHAQAEDGSGDVIMRLFESAGGAVDTVLQVAAELQLQAVREVDLLERPLTPPDAAAAATVECGDRSGEVRLRFAPYEIKTLRLRLQNCDSRSQHCKL